MPMPQEPINRASWVRALAFEVPQANVIDYFDPWPVWVAQFALATGNEFVIPSPQGYPTFEKWVRDFYGLNA
jgi:hypothetical protein